LFSWKQDSGHFSHVIHSMAPWTVVLTQE